MASPPLPPNPCLVAIILMVKFYNEPQVVFHYPPRPGEDNSHYKNYLSGDLTDDDSTNSSDDESTKSSDERSKHDGGKAEFSKNGISPDADPDPDDAGSASPEKRDRVNPARQARWNDLFGFPSTMLAKLLCPVSSNHKKRFEMGIDEKVFLGWPVYKRDGKGWERKRRPRISKSTDIGSEVKNFLGQGGRKSISEKTSDQLSEEHIEDLGPGTKSEDEPPALSESVPAVELAPGRPSTQSIGNHKDIEQEQDMAESKPIDTLEMFNIVFVLDPPPLEHHLRVDEMYNHVVKKFSRALKWEQVRSKYVAREASSISHLYRYGGEMYAQGFKRNLIVYRAKSSPGAIIPQAPLAVEPRKSDIHPLH